ncbi:MAG: hypothetical protein OEW18_04255, partial [Candidatus Aminicenantes bacterium]|nr:hypothetical protein [Candidatus Aminicenantes bacterium]
SSIGGLVTDRRGRDYRNSVYGVDGHFQLAPTDRIVFQLLGSRTDYPDLLSAEEGKPHGAFQGLAWNVFYGHEARNWHWWLKTESLGRGFRADAGFIPRVDTRTAEAGLCRVIWPKKETWFGRLNVTLEGLYTEDQGGHLTDKALKLGSEIQGPLRSALRVGFVAYKELFKNVFFDQKFLEFGLSVHPRQDLALMLSGKWGEAVDYAGLRPGRVVRANPGLVYFLNRHLQIQLDQLWERLAVAGGRLYLASLSQGHLVYQFSTRAFLRAVLQYQNVQGNRALQSSGVDLLNPHLFTQFLFSYKVNPQTLLFLGYSDNQYGWQGANISPKDRTFFFKLSYAWVQ